MSALNGHQLTLTVMGTLQSNTTTMAHVNCPQRKRGEGLTRDSLRIRASAPMLTRLRV